MEEPPPPEPEPLDAGDALDAALGAPEPAFGEE
jgi:hypothetical protein